MSSNNPGIPQLQTQNPTDKKLKLINDAREVLRGGRLLTIAQLENLHLELKHYDQFAYATEILLVKMKMDEDNGRALLLSDYQKLALYIYKDHSLPSMFKFPKALNEIQTHDDLAKTLNCESLGLAGAVFKRKWQFDHQFKNLILSRYYYRRGYLSWKEYLAKENRINDDSQNDYGFTAINYAYVSELMAVDKLEEHGGITGLSETINAKFNEAKEVRTFILTQFVSDAESDNPSLKQNDYPKWVLATLAEAFFGLRKYTQSLQFIRQYIHKVTNESWEIRTFTQQLFSLAYLQESQKKFAKTHTGKIDQTDFQRSIANIDTEKIYECVNASIQHPGEHADTPGNAIISEIKKGGKQGLALSGGGFRASLFHIGVLAALAENDELRNVEVLSCVSGGSIIGAYYYIKLKSLLESKADADIKKNNYIEIVQETEKDFLAGVQKNLRVMIFSDLASNFKMLTDKNYSRTHRLGELYEQHLYKQIWFGGSDIYMSDLRIKPKDSNESFDIATDNWKRINKVPQLILNATSVNTGHNWQFTASWMGEPPGNIQADIDVKPRLRRMYYKEAPEQYQKFRLGYAVGASSCVPVMFHPMPMYDLYPGIDLQLIDGGLHDNQGIAALIEQECSNMIISDASGQLPTTKVSAANEAAVFYRADNILQERLRELQFMDLKERNYTAQLNQLISVHLKSDLQQNPVNWRYCIDPARTIVYADLTQQNKDLVNFGILKTVQTSLSNIRTDLDAFNDLEAQALMYSGYLQTHYEWNKHNHCENPVRDESLWEFSSIREYVTIPKKAEEISKVLEVGSKQFLKVPYLSKPVKIISLVILFLIALALLSLIIKYWNDPISTITVKALVFAMILFFLGKLVKGAGLLLNRGAEIKKWVFLLGIAIFGFFASIFYLAILNPIYNKAGRVKSK